MNLKQIYASMTDADIETEINNNLQNLSYCTELWKELDRRYSERELLSELHYNK